MDIKVLKEVLECMPKERTFFYYYNDRYAVYLLQKQLENGSKKVSVLKNGKYGKLLNKPVFKPVLAEKGSGRLSAKDMDILWPDNPQTFTLTLDYWGDVKDYRWEQVSRPGYNLVLQLNLPGDIDYEFQKFMKVGPNFFNSCAHPCNSRKTTLAWARIDMDFDANEALIEEIQNDWLRRLRLIYKVAKKRKFGKFMFWEQQFCAQSVINFYESMVKPLEKQWAEAMLMAAIWFIWEELGIRHIYYHSFDTGRVLKNIDGKAPPESLYTDLPKKFCFNKTPTGPMMVTTERKIKRKLRKLKSPQWHYLPHCDAA